MKPHELHLGGMARGVCVIPTDIRAKETIMKRIAALSILALGVSGAAVAQSDDMKSGSKAEGTSKNGAVHKTSAVVTAVDRVKGTVTLAHGPVKSLKWQAMTMAFSVQDKALFDKLAAGKKVNVEFTQQGSGYVVTAVR
jgi:Cu(I)/Ag(I) efflux system protein CusF